MRSVQFPIDGSDCLQRSVHSLPGVRTAWGGPTPRLNDGPLAMKCAAAAIDECQFEQSSAMLCPARDLLPAAGIDYEYCREVGHEADSSFLCSESLGCDHIVTSRHRRPALADFIAGSTTLEALHQTRLAVVLVK